MRTVEQTLIEPGRYYTIAAASGNVIGYTEKPEDGAELRLGKYEHKPEQEWLFDRVGENAYRIHCRANGKVIDLMMAGTDNGTWLHLWDDVLGSSQMWTLVPENDGTVRLVSPWASGKCVDTVGMGSPAGAILQIWQESPGADQLWTIRAVKDRKAAEPAEEVKTEAPVAEVKAEEPAKAEEPVAEAAPAVEAAAEPAPKKRACRTKKAEETAAPAVEVKAEEKAAPAAEVKAEEPAAPAAPAASAAKRGGRTKSASASKRRSRKK